MSAIRNGDRNQARQAQERFRDSTRRQPAQPSRLPRILLSLFLLLFIGGGLYFGCVFVSVLRSLMTASPTTAAEGSSGGLPVQIPFISPSTTPGGEQSAEGGNVEEPAPWTGTDRINILLLGVDQREDERGQPTRTDTMIVLTIDPKTKSAGMLSIPRDLWVPIPGHGENKINTAHFFGDMDSPGGGPELARKTVELNFGIHIQHYARVDFTGFEKLIDTLGGVTIDVPRPLKDDEYPTPDYGIQRIYIPAGLQRMDGRTALQYARSRHSDNDFGRTHRQQQVLVAAREEAFRLDLLPKLPTLMGTLRDSITTDFPFTDIPSFAMLIRDIDAKNVKNVTIEGDMVIDVNGDGTVLVPVRDKIREAIDSMFERPGPTPTPATIAVHNGTDRAGLAGAIADFLRQKGLQVAEVGNDTRADREQTVIISYSNNHDDTVQEIASLLKVNKENIRHNSSTDSTVDILIILGADAKVPVQ